MFRKEVAPFYKVLHRVKKTSSFWLYIPAGVILLGFLGYVGYNWHMTKTQRNAQMAFAESLAMYHQALMGSLSEHAGDISWDEVDLAFKTAYEQNRGSSFKPFYLAYQAQAQARAGRLENAIQLIDDAIVAAPRNSIFAFQFKTMKALLLLDAGQEAAGVDLLDALAQDQKNPAADMAAFYEGYYYLSKDQAKALAILRPLAATPVDPVRQVSPWVAMAQGMVERLG